MQYATLVPLTTLFFSYIAFSIPLDFLKDEKAVANLDIANVIGKAHSIVLTASPVTLNTSGDWATVTWSGVSDPDKMDRIGVYTYPAVEENSIDSKKHVPYCKLSSDYLSKGEGSLSFYLVNMRAPYIFAFLRKRLYHPEVAALSNVIQFVNPNEPLQGHLMLTGDPTQMKLMWVTKDSDNPEVRWSPALLGTTIVTTKATSTTYNASDMCGSPATDVGFIDPGQIHTATFRDLFPGQSIFYRFGDDNYGWSDLYNFTVPPLPGANATTRILAFGDMGQGQRDDSIQEVPAQVPSLNTTRLLLRDLNQTDLILHIGDISYARGYAGVWDECFDQIQPLATHVPYMVSVGNHEVDWPNSRSYYATLDSGGECGVPYEKRFPMPGTERNKNWYTFKMGSVQVVVMSTEHNYSTDSQQYNWINNTLFKVDRSVTPWLIFTGHRPMYVDCPFNSGNSSEVSVSQQLIEHIEPLLMQYRVDLCLWAHIHSYQRTCQVYKSKCTKGAPVHVVIGMAGQIHTKFLESEKPFWLEEYDVEHYGYSRITTNETTLLFEYVRDDDGEVHDTLVLNK